MLIPFHTQEIMQPGGIYYGQNAVSKKMCIRDSLCSLVVLEECSKVGAFPALWWLSGTEVAGKCLKAPEKCRM